MILIRLVLLLLIQGCAAFRYNRIFTTGGHTHLVTTISFFNDGRRFITGSNDNKTKVWSVTNFSMLHQFTYGDNVMNVALHPIDNRIFVLVYDGNIFVYDPITYAQVHTFTYPGFNANYMIFQKNLDRFIMGGYDGATSPVLYFYNASTYASLTSLTTGLPSGDEVNTISMNPSGTHIVVTNLATLITTYKIQVYRLSDLSLISSFTDPTDKIRWTFYSNIDDFFCSTSRDLHIRCYGFSPTSQTYSLNKYWTFSTFPYCMTFGFGDTVVVTVDNNIQFHMVSKTTSLRKLYYTIQDVAPVFVIANTPNMSYFATGMGNGSISLWEFVADQESKSDQAVAEYYQSMNSTRNLAIGLGVGLGGLALIIIIGSALCLCGCCDRCRKKVNQEHDQSMNRLEGDQGADKFLVIKGDQHRSNVSSDIDYDELMAHGTVIVIKDEEKKKKYIEGLKKKQLENSDKKDSYLDNLLNVKGHIIIIRDDDHSEYRKNKKNKSDKSSDLDYEELMAQGNVIIIKDEDTKQKFIKKLKKKDNNTNYQGLMAEGNIIIIRGEEQQKIYLKQLNKQQDLKNIKHDQIFAEGDIIVIKDQEKKKEFVSKMKKELQKNKQSTKDLASIEVAQQIIVICGDDDQDMTYEQLMAQGTVIVIKDDDTKMQYKKYLRKQNGKGEKARKGSDKSSEPDYDTLMAQQCIIVIKDEDSKQNFANFVKKRRLNSDKSSEMDYDELMNNGNIMSIRQDNRNSKRNNSSGKINSTNQIQIKPSPDYQKIMAEKNVIVINEESADKPNQSQLKEISKSYPLKK